MQLFPVMVGFHRSNVRPRIQAFGICILLLWVLHTSGANSSATAQAHDLIDCPTGEIFIESSYLDKGVMEFRRNRGYSTSTINYFSTSSKYEYCYVIIKFDHCDMQSLCKSSEVHANTQVWFNVDDGVLPQDDKTVIATTHPLVIKYRYREMEPFQDRVRKTAEKLTGTTKTETDKLLAHLSFAQSSGATLDPPRSLETDWEFAPSLKKAPSTTTSAAKIVTPLIGSISSKPSNSNIALSVGSEESPKKSLESSSEDNEIQWQYVGPIIVLVALFVLVSVIAISLFVKIGKMKNELIKNKFICRNYEDAAAKDFNAALELEWSQHTIARQLGKYAEQLDNKCTKIYELAGKTPEIESAYQTFKENLKSHHFEIEKLNQNILKTRTDSQFDRRVEFRKKELERERKNMLATKAQVEEVERLDKEALEIFGSTKEIKSDKQSNNQSTAEAQADGQKKTDQNSIVDQKDQKKVDQNSKMEQHPVNQQIPKPKPEVQKNATPH